MDLIHLKWRMLDKNQFQQQAKSLLWLRMAEEAVHDTVTKKWKQTNSTIC
jgi:hypothetical protein